MIIFDCETTGLVPEREAVLEFAMLNVADDLSVVHGGFHTLVRFDFDWWCKTRGTPDDIVLDMHAKSGLWETLAAAGDEAPLLVNAEAAAMQWLDNQGITRGEEPMVGSSILFDRRMLFAHMPTLETMFFYRNIDTSSVKELVRRWRKPVYEQLPPARKLHRALPDCYDTLNELQFYKCRVMDYWTSPFNPIPGPEGT